MTRVERRNATFQVLDALRHNRRKREQRREAIVDGVQPIDRCLAAGWTVRSIVLRVGGVPSRWAAGVLAAVPDAERLELAPELYAEVVDRADPPELFLVVAVPSLELADVPRSADGAVVLVDRPSSPGNLGTIVRTADALGATGVLTTGHGAHLYDPRTIRASVGSIFSIPVVVVEGHRALAEWLEGWRAAAPSLRVYATDESGELLLRRDTRLERPALLLLGSERPGLSNALRDLADTAIAIPMSGSATSLNVAVAHGIVLHHLLAE